MCARTLGAWSKAARRAATRRVAVLREIAKEADSDMRHDIQQQISNFERLQGLTRLYSGGKRIPGRTVEERRQAVIELERAVKAAPTRREAGDYLDTRSNAVFINDLKVASSGAKIESMSEVEARMFMRATQRAWEGVEKDKRFEAIMERYNVRSLDLLFKRFKRENAEQIELVQRLQDGATPDDLTPEQKELLMQLKAEDDSQFARYRPNDPSSPAIGSVARMTVELEMPD